MGKENRLPLLDALLLKPRVPDRDAVVLCIFSGKALKEDCLGAGRHGRSGSLAVFVGSSDLRKAPAR